MSRRPLISTYLSGFGGSIIGESISEFLIRPWICCYQWLPRLNPNEVNTMLTLSKILFPVDFSDRCRHSAHYVLSLARLFDSEITLLHVVVPVQDWIGSPEAGVGFTPDFWESRVQSAEAYLNDFLAGQLKSQNVNRVLLQGDPGREIVRYSQEQNVDLIVMPTHGYGPFRRFLLGSVTAKVLHDAEAPVLTGAHLEEMPDLTGQNFQRVVCAIDLREQSKDTLRWAGELASQYRARLTIVHATSPGDPSMGGVYVDPDFELRLGEMARQSVGKLQAELGLESETVVRAGDPADVVHAVAEETHADLVVIGRARGGFLGRLRAHAYAIIRESPVPVVSV